MCVHYTCIVILVIVVVTLPSVGHTALLFENDLAALATGYIIVIVDHGCAAVACLGIIRLAEFRGHRTELTVDHHVVDHVHQGVLLHIDAATLLAVTSPTGVDDGVVVGVDLGHATCDAFVGGHTGVGIGVVGLHAKPVEVFHHIHLRTQVTGITEVHGLIIGVLSLVDQTILDRVLQPFIEEADHELLRGFREKLIAQVDVIGHGVL